MSGTVTRWQLINPHSGLWLSITSLDGDTVEWAAEFQGTLTFRLREFELAEFICQELMLSQLPEMRPGQAD